MPFSQMRGRVRAPFGARSVSDSQTSLRQGVPIPRGPGTGGTCLLSHDGFKGAVRLALIHESGQRLAFNAQGMGEVPGESV